MTTSGSRADPASIGDHGLIGDLHTAALVDRWGSLNWLCWPRFDDPPVFDRLLDPVDGGSWDIAPSVDFEAFRRYLPDTNIIETTFNTASGPAVLRDFFAVPVDDAGSQVIRILEARSGEVPVEVILRPGRRFGTGRPLLARVQGGVRIGEDLATVAANSPMKITGETAKAEVTVRPGAPLVGVLSAGSARVDLAGLAARLEQQTARWWQNWVRGCDLPSDYTKDVVRSVLTLKLLTHESTCGVVAAPTTSLPEQPGGPRNWDYRYTWLRDTALTVLALQQLGKHDEAMAFWGWLERAAARHGPDLAIAYTLDGNTVPPEREIPNLAGHQGSRPVRVGNDAATQRQHDVYGYVMSSAAHCYHHMDMDTAQPAELLSALADHAAERWDEPDDGIWEVRSGRDNFVHSRLMCWLALDRAIDLADSAAMVGDTARWRTQREAIRQQIQTRAWNRELGAFTRTIDGTELDAAALVAPLIGFLPADDPRCRGTRSAVTERLSDHGLLRRYSGTDGVTGSEGVFLLCSLWLADNHTLDGDWDRAAELLERVLRTGNDLGLLAEEADPATDAPLGNFPQGLTHLGVIQTATWLHRARN